MGDRWYSNGSWFKGKLGFILVMVAATALSFVARLRVVYNWGWAREVDNLLEPLQMRVAIAVIMPPLVDAVQTVFLILASKLARGDMQPALDVSTKRPPV